MNNKDKFIIRSSILELSEKGTPRNISIDDKIKVSLKEREKTSNLWDSITALGAQLSRPPYDPYREIINLGVCVGRRQCKHKVILSMPLILYDNYINIEETSFESLHTALNWLSINDNINLGMISDKNIKNNRKYAYFKRINTNSIIEEIVEDNKLEGVVLQYNNDYDKFIQFLVDLRKKFNGPILVEINDEFDKSIKSILDEGADGIVADTVKITNKGKYKGTHAITVIKDLRHIINKYYTGKENDGALLVVAGDFNDTGRIVKAAALGANIIEYSTSLLIANAANHYENICNIDTISKRIYRHILATNGELKGVPAALGYSNFYNMSSADLRTSSIEASLQADIAIEGKNKTYRQIIEELIDEYEIEEGIEFDKEKKQRIVNYLLTNR